MIIIDAIINKLKPLEAKVYDEHIEQGFEKPSFFVLEINRQYAQVATLGRKQFIFDMNIRYHPKDEDNPRNECTDIAQQLCFLLERIKYKDEVFKGQQISHKIEDGVLLFFITYVVDFYIVNDEAIKMQILEELNEGVK